MLLVKRVVGSVLSSNMYIIHNENTSDCWLIDIGDFKELEKHLESNANVKGLFITHGHFDHIADINLLYANFPNVKIFTSEYGKEQLLSEKKNFSYYHDKSTSYNGNHELISVINETSTIEIFPQIYLNILSTPGHCPSCLTYYTDDYIFTGDSYIPGIKVVTNLPKGNKIQAQESVEKIQNIIGTKIICPGHGDMIDYQIKICKKSI